MASFALRYPDLGLPDSYYPPQPQSADHILPNEEEGVFCDAHGKQVGYIKRVVRHAIQDATQLADAGDLSHLKSVSAAVGRVVCRYVSASGSLRFFSGTGVVVAPRLVLTAMHVVKPVHVVKLDDDKEEHCHLDKVYFSTNDELSIGDGNGLDEVCVELAHPSPTRQVDSLFQGCYTLLDGTQWKTCNDFCFLPIATGTSFQMAFPCPCASHTGDQAVVIGYPSDITADKFAQDYANSNSTNTDSTDPPTPASPISFFFQISAQCNGFERKIASFGEAPNSTSMSELHHRCPTLRGTSGSPLVIFEKSNYTRPSFAALHIGGSHHVQSNLAVRVSDPAFAYEYIHQVILANCDVAFLRTNRQQLIEYLTPLAEQDALQECANAALDIVLQTDVPSNTAGSAQ